MDWQEVIKEAFKRLGKEIYTNPYADDIANLEKEIVRLQEIQRGVEIPSKNASVKDFQARIQAKALYAEINGDLAKVISEHNHLIESSKAHFVDFKQEIVEVIQAVNTVPSVDYGHHGKIGLDDETYKTLLFDANEGQIAEYFEVLASQEQYEMNGSTRILKGFFDPNREAVSSFIDNYSLSKEDILAIVATSNEILKEEERKQKEAITQALLEKSPDVQSYSRNYTGEQETKVDADGTINLGTLTTKGTVFLDDKQEGNITKVDNVTGVEVSRV